MMRKRIHVVLRRKESSGFLILYEIVCFFGVVSSFAGVQTTDLCIRKIEAA